MRKVVSLFLCLVLSQQAWSVDTSTTQVMQNDVERVTIASQNGVALKVVDLLNGMDADALAKAAIQMLTRDKSPASQARKINMLNVLMQTCQLPEQTLHEISSCIATTVQGHNPQDPNLSRLNYFTISSVAYKTAEDLTKNQQSGVSDSSLLPILRRNDTPSEREIRILAGTFLEISDLATPTQEWKARMREFPSADIPLIISKLRAQNTDSKLQLTEMLAECLHRPELKPNLRQQALDAISDVLKQPNYILKKFAIQMLAKFGDTSRIGLIVPLLQDDNSDIRATAADALAALGNNSTIPIIEAAIKRRVEQPVVNGSPDFDLFRMRRALELLKERSKSSQ